MDKQLQTIAALLGSEVPNRRLAAAIVLGELAPPDADVVRALGSALGHADDTLTRELVNALGRTRHKTAFPYLLPLLLNAPPALRDAAGKALAQLKMDIEAELEKVWAKAATVQKLALMDVFARLHSDGATRFLLTGLFDPDFEMVKAICGAIRRHINDANEEERKDLFKQIASFLKTPRVKKDMRATTSCLILLGSLGNPAARSLLLDYIGPKQVAFVRRNALQSLANLSRDGAGVDAMIKKVLPLLKEEDRENVVSPAIALLAPLEFPASVVGDLEKLAKSENTEVRRFAVRKLGHQTGKKIVGAMLDWLSDADQEVRDIAAKALCRIEDATQPLLEKLGKVTTADDAWNVVKLLKPHADRFAKDAKKKLAVRCLDLLEKNDPRVPAYTWLLRNVDAAGFNVEIAEAGEDLRQRKKFAAAVQSLRLLANTELFNATVRYQLSFSGLKTSPKDLSPGRRGEDPCLRGFTALMRDPSFKLLDSLAKDKKLLEPEDVFYLGFHLAESALGHERQFSQQIFEFLIKTWPKSEQAKAAKNKLKTEGPIPLQPTVFEKQQVKPPSIEPPKPIVKLPPIVPPKPKMEQPKDFKPKGDVPTISVPREASVMKATGFKPTEEVPTFSVAWEILEPDGNQWNRLVSYYKRLEEVRHERYDMQRLKVLYTLKPDKVFTGKDSFDGYVVFVFEKLGTAALECPQVGNALYLMQTSDWRPLSQLSKTELLEHHHKEVKRVIHTESKWASVVKKNLKQFLRPRTAK